MSYPIKQSSTQSPLLFFMVLTSDHITGATGLSPTVTISKAGASFASPSGAVTEIGNGWYKVAGNATDTATLGPIALHATAGTADPCDLIAGMVVAYDPQDAVHLGITSLPNTACTTNASLLTSGTGTDQLSVSAGKVLLQATQTGVTIPTVTTVTNQLTAAAIATGVWQDTTAGDFTVASSIGKSLYTSGAAPGAASGLLIAGSNAATTFATLTSTGAFSINGTSDVAQTGDSFARLGSTGSGLTSLAPASTALSTATWTGTLAANLATLAGHDPGAMLASQTNITAGTISTIASGGISRASFTADSGLQSVRSNTAQAGGASTITLDASASATDNFYRGELIYLTGGTGAGQYRICTGYVGATKVATVTPAWTTNPDATSTFAIEAAGMVDLETILFTASAGVAGYIGPDWSHVNAPTSTVGLSGTTVGTLTTYTGNTPQTGDSFARIGATGSGLSSLAPASTALSTATWTGTLATNLATLAGHDPGATLGTSTLTQAQVTGGTFALNSASFAFNAALDFTTTQKTSLSSSAVASVTGAVGSIASGGITATSFAANTGLQPIHTGTAQSGSSTSISLDAGALATDNFYNGAVVYITGGTGVGQYAVIRDYVGASRIALIASAGASGDWVVNPDNTSTFAILPHGSVNVAAWILGSVTATSGTPNVNVTRWGASGSNVTSSSIPVSTAAGSAGGLAIVGSQMDFVSAPNATAITAIQSGLSTLTTSQVLTTVWDSSISGHTTGGTFGGALNAAGSAGDPWATTLPGAYSAGTAGFILGTNLDTTVSSRSTLTQTQITGGVYALNSASFSFNTALDFTTTQKTSLTTTTDALQTALASAHGAGSWTTATGFAVAGDAMTLTSGAYSAVADTTLRRGMAAVEGSSSGDALSLSSLYGMVQQAQESDTTTTAGKLTIYKTDGSTILGATTLSSDSGAAPITGNKLT